MNDFGHGRFYLTVICLTSYKIRNICGIWHRRYNDYNYSDYSDIPFNPSTDGYVNPTDTIGMTSDGLHPSYKGQKKIAKMFDKAIKKY